MVKVNFYYKTNSTEAASSEILTVTNSTKMNGNFLVSLIGFDTRITYDNVGDHNYVFIVQSYNILGVGGNTTSA